MSAERVGTVTLRASGLTDLGRKRRNNEDALLIANLSDGRRVQEPGRDIDLQVGERGILLAVCDGMGGSEAGEVASAMTLDALLRGTATAMDALGPQAALDAGGQLANREVSAAASTSERKGMGTTLTACLVHGTTAYVAEVGDSRAYVLRAGRLAQLTKDQSYVQLLVDSGVSTRAARQSTFSNVILQAVGRAPALTLGLTRLSLRRGDTLLLCSDGLSNMVPDADIADILSRDAREAALCRSLVDRANDRGGKDNVTVIVARVSGSGVEEGPRDEDIADTVQTLGRYEP